MFRKLLMLAVIILVCMLCSCNLPVGKPVEDRLVVTVVGLDKEDELYTMTVLTQMTHMGSSEDAPEYPNTKIFTDSGETWFDILRNMHTFADYDIFFGNLHFIIIGEDFAREGLGNSLDFFVRDHEPRLTAGVMVSLGTSAKDFIENTDMTSSELTDKLDSLFGAADALSEAKEVTLLDFTKMMDSEHTQPYLPCVSRVDRSIKLEERHEEDKWDVQLNGYALFKRDKMVAIARNKVARGVSWLINEVKTGIIVVNDPEGSKVSLEIIDADVNIKPYFNEEPSVTFEVKFSTNIGEILGNTDIFTEDILYELTSKQEKAVQQEITDAMELMKAHQSDIVGIGDAFYHENPIEWNLIKGDWCNLFSEIPYNFEFASRINRTYVIIPPIEKKSGGSK